MSAILEALKKSEQERKLGQSPDIQSIHHGMALSQRGDKTPTALWLIGALLLISLAAVLYIVWLNLSTPRYSVEQYSAKVSAERQAKIADSQAISQEGNETGEQTEAEPVIQPNTEQQATVAQKPEAQLKDERVAIPLWQLPNNIRSDLPAMTYSFHVYSDAKENRTIIINGRRLKEGDAISQDLHLHEITAEGVVLDFQQHLVFVPVLEGW